ncbi:hypothetical protein ALC53_10309 [Atta colombica]|uniref:Uncharacterized protein n=1 Tax=Atta colombica TaxID=520822 RepID=A0A195B4E1_9HYME|nr:hypothetical protein ALC53_10309 [Atta colombica]
MPNPRRRGRQRESVGGLGGYFTDIQKTVVTICIGTLILAPDVSSCLSGPDCSAPFDRLTSATNAPFSMLVFESTKRTNRVLLRAASSCELFVELIVIIVVVIVVVVVKYNPPVLVDVALISRSEEASIGEVARSDSLSDSSETSHPFLPRLLCLYTRLLDGASNPCHSLEGTISALMVMLDCVEKSSKLLNVSLCLSSAIFGIISSVRVPAASLTSPIELVICSDGRSTVDSGKSNRIVDTVRRSFDERQAVRTCRGALNVSFSGDMTTGIQRRKSEATTLTKSAEWIT